MENRYPNIARGLKVVFWAYLLGIVVPVVLDAAILLLRAATIQGSISPTIYPFFTDTAQLWELLPTLLFGLLGLLGLNLARKENRRYALAMLLTLGVLGVKVWQALNPQTSLDLTLPLMASVLGSLLQFGVLFFACTATAQLLRQRGEERLAKQSRAVWITYGLLSITVILLPFVGMLTGAMVALSLISLAAAGAGGIALQVLYLGFLWKSARILGTAVQPALAEEG